MILHVGGDLNARRVCIYQMKRSISPPPPPPPNRGLEPILVEPPSSSSSSFSSSVSYLPSHNGKRIRRTQTGKEEEGNIAKRKKGKRGGDLCENWENAELIFFLFKKSNASRTECSDIFLNFANVF